MKKIGVLVKQVPASDSELVFDAGQTWIDESAIEYDINEADQYALEAAMQLTESAGGEVIAISLGPELVEEVLETALAKGADSAIHIVDDRGHDLDTFQVAEAFARVAKEESFDLMLAGILSDDLGSGQTPVVLADLLDWYHATMVVRIDASENGLIVRRELESGWFQDMELPTPAVLAIQSGINQPRYASMRSIMAARRKTVREVSGPDVIPADAASGTRIERVYSLEQSKNVEILHGSPAEQAEALVQKLRYSARVL